MRHSLEAEPEGARERALKRLTGKAASLVAIAVGAVLVLAVRMPVPGLIVTLAGVVGLTVALLRSVGDGGRRERQRRGQADPPHDPDRVYFDALRAVPPATTAWKPAAAGSDVEDAESQGSYIPGVHRRPGTGRR
ncbi:hypothetical protein [Actinocrinis sp.]|uniref:hypothetical protein n=1 Tax=Actinocrinis sp. TaxID=1920516 RepID=UPI002D457348|nr:hypothetical protein [Actinocrinis sp.]HZP49615.1 hypothetical protein [Actinocrinis sp.]